MTTETPEAPEAPAHVVTDERAQMLANHVIYVQGGFSDAATERARAEDEITRGGSIDWHAMKAEVMTAIAARMASLPPERTHAAPAPAAAASAAAEVEVGTIVVRYPHRNRSNIVKAKVQEKLSPEDYAECITETSYRTLLYGESGS
jgi:hypothetical protein